MVSLETKPFKKMAALLPHQTNPFLRAVPTIVIAHTFCASQDTRVFLSVMLSNSDIFAWFKTIRTK